MTKITFELDELLTLKTTRAKVQVKSWQEAADIVGNLLVDEGKVQPGYVARMKEVIDEVGPYMVIAPGVALLHARPEHGVNMPCIALITLDEPVPFGHAENDPVDIVFAFGATDKDSHVPALKKLAKQISRSEVIESVRSAHSDKALCEAFVELCDHPNRTK